MRAKPQLSFYNVVNALGSHWLYFLTTLQPRKFDWKNIEYTSIFREKKLNVDFPLFSLNEFIKRNVLYLFALDSIQKSSEKNSRKFYQWRPFQALTLMTLQKKHDFFDFFAKLSVRRLSSAVTKKLLICQLARPSSKIYLTNSSRQPRYLVALNDDEKAEEI